MVVVFLDVFFTGDGKFDGKSVDFSDKVFLHGTRTRLSENESSRTSSFSFFFFFFKVGKRSLYKRLIFFKFSCEICSLYRVLEGVFSKGL